MLPWNQKSTLPPEQWSGGFSCIYIYIPILSRASLTCFKLLPNSYKTCFKYVQTDYAMASLGPTNSAVGSSFCSEIKIMDPQEGGFRHLV